MSRFGSVPVKLKIRFADNEQRQQSPTLVEASEAGRNRQLERFINNEILFGDSDMDLIALIIPLIALIVSLSRSLRSVHIEFEKIEIDLRSKSGKIIAKDIQAEDATRVLEKILESDQVEMKVADEK